MKSRLKPALIAATTTIFITKTISLAILGSPQVARVESATISYRAATQLYNTSKVAIRPSGKSFVRIIDVLDANFKTLTPSDINLGSTIRAVAGHPSDSSLLFVTTTKAFMVNVDSGATIKAFTGHTLMMKGLAVEPGTNFIWCGGDDEKLLQYDYSGSQLSPTKSSTLSIPTDIRSIRPLLPESGNEIAFGQETKTVSFVDKTGDLSSTTRTFTNPVSTIEGIQTIDVDKNMVIVVDHSVYISKLNIANPAITNTRIYICATGPAYNISPVPRTHYALSICKGQDIKLLNLNMNSVVFGKNSHANPYYALYLGDFRRTISIGHSSTTKGEIKLWDSSLEASCHQTCSTCQTLNAGPNGCLSCPSSKFLRNDGTCGSNCHQNEYQKSANTCGLCHSSCKTCSGELATECASCNGAQVLRADKSCQNSCLSSSFLASAGVCQACDGNCETCSGSAVQCTSCQIPKVLKTDKTCSTGCDSNEFLPTSTSTHCQLCDTNCLTCSGSSTNCQTCRSGEVLRTDKTCSTSCSSTEYLSSNTECQICDTNCFTCENSSKKCTSCLADQVLRTDSTCGPSCLSNEFLSSPTTCTKCDDTCLTCNGPLNTDCLTCQNQHWEYLSKAKECLSCNTEHCPACQTDSCSECLKGSKTEGCTKIAEYSLSRKIYGEPETGLVNISLIISIDSHQESIELQKVIDLNYFTIKASNKTLLAKVEHKSSTETGDFMVTEKLQIYKDSPNSLSITIYRAIEIPPSGTSFEITVSANRSTLKFPKNSTTNTPILLLNNKTQSTIIQLPVLAQSEVAKAKVAAVFNSSKGATQVAGAAIPTISTILLFNVIGILIKFFQIIEVLLNLALINSKLGPLIESVIEVLRTLKFPIKLKKDFFWKDYKTQARRLFWRYRFKLTIYEGDLFILCNETLFVLLYITSWLLYSIFEGIWAIDKYLNREAEEKKEALIRKKKNLVIASLNKRINYKKEDHKKEAGEELEEETKIERLIRWSQQFKEFFFSFAYFDIQFITFNELLHSDVTKFRGAGSIEAISYMLSFLVLTLTILDLKNYLETSVRLSRKVAAGKELTKSEVLKSSFFLEDIKVDQKVPLTSLLFNLASMIRFSVYQVIIASFQLTPNFQTGLLLLLQIAFMVYYGRNYCRDKFISSCVCLMRVIAFEVCILLFLGLGFIFSFEKSQSWFSASILGWLQILAAALILMSVFVEFIYMVCKMVQNFYEMIFGKGKKGGIKKKVEKNKKVKKSEKIGSSSNRALNNHKDDKLSPKKKPKKSLRDFILAGDGDEPQSPFQAKIKKKSNKRKGKRSGKKLMTQNRRNSKFRKMFGKRWKPKQSEKGNLDFGMMTNSPGRVDSLADKTFRYKGRDVSCNKLRVGVWRRAFVKQQSTAQSEGSKINLQRMRGSIWKAEKLKLRHEEAQGVSEERSEG